MSFIFASQKISFREVTYKLKKDNIENDGPVKAKTTINFSDPKASIVDEKIIIRANVKILLDTDDIFFEAAFVFKAEMKKNMIDHNIYDPKSFVDANESEIEQQTMALVRTQLNDKVNEFLRMTVTAPTKRTEFWPIDDSEHRENPTVVSSASTSVSEKGLD